MTLTLYPDGWCEFDSEYNFCRRTHHFPPPRTPPRICWNGAGGFADARLGPTKARQLVEHFVTPEAVFRASLTELESTGFQPVSAPSLAAGKSAELVREEIASATAADAMMMSMDDLSYPPRLKEVHDPPLILRVRSNLGVLTNPGIAMLNTRPSL